MKKSNINCRSYLQSLQKILLIMKLSIFLLVFMLFQVHAENSYSQITSLTVNLENKPLEEVFDIIESQSEFYFLYNEKLINAKREVSLNANDKNVIEILRQLFDGTNIKYSIIDKIIILAPEEIANNNQSINVTGIVKDSQGNPLPGVNVIEKGTTNGTVSNLDGKYTIEVSSLNATLSFSFVGYLTEEIAVGGKTTIDIILVEDIMQLDEVVVTALGIQREKKALGYSIQAFEGDELQTVKGVDIGTSLTGKIAGLLVKNSTEFATDPTIEIRGEEPLLVIDGVPYGNMTLRDIPSDDIETISVLKGATASALYGYRGESGAIMVTTKKGSKNKGISVSVNSSTMFAAGYLAIPEMQSTFGRKVNTSTNTYNLAGQGSWGVPMEGQNIIQWDPISKSYQSMPYLPIGKDNFKNYLEPGFIVNNNLSITQQGEYGSVRSSATWVKNKGQYPNSMFDKITYSLGGDIKLDKFSLSSSFTYNKQTSPNVGFSGYTGYDPMYNILIWSSPDYDIRDYKDYWLVENETQNSSYTSINNNPYFDRYERIHSVDRDIFNGTLSLDYEFLPGLKATFRTGYDTYSNNQIVRISKGSFQGGGSSTVITNGTQIWGESMKGSYNFGLERGYSLNNDLLLSVNKTIGKLTVDGLFGGSLFYTKDEGMQARTQGGLSIPGFYSLQASVNSVAVSSRIYKRQVNSLLGRLSLSWESLLFVEGTLRNDWSSTLPESTRSYLYPSIASSFVLSELLPETDWLSFWKLRGSWTNSKIPAGIYDINAVYSITQNDWGDLNSASYPTTIRGTDLRPESTETYEVGTMINLFNNRASFDIAYYKKRFYDIIDDATISAASGYTTNYINRDEEYERKGVEITANVVPVKSTDWRWDLTFNWTKYAKFYTQLDEFSQDLPWVKVGERTDHYVSKEFLQDPNGNIIYSSGLPVYSSYNSLFGYSDPDWIWGLATSVDYKNFKLSISADGRVGGIAQTITEMYMWNSGNHPESVTDERYLDATTGTANYVGDGVQVSSGSVTFDTYGNITEDTREYTTNDVAVTYENYIKRIHRGTAWGGNPSPYDVYSTTFFKIREVSLTYSLPEKLYSRIKAKGGSISAVGQNVFLWAKDFKYSDPDGGSENFSDPSIRYLGLNVKLSF